MQQDVSNARKTSTKSNCFELRWKLFWSVCKLPRILSNWNILAFFVSFYTIFMKSEFLYVSLRFLTKKTSTKRCVSLTYKEENKH